MMRLLAAACLLILVGSAGDTYVAAEARLQHTAAGGSMQLGGGSAQQRRHLLASGSVGGGSIAGIVVGMAVLAAAVGIVCFWLGRRSAAAAAAAARDGGGDVEVGLLNSDDKTTAGRRMSTTEKVASFTGWQSVDVLPAAKAMAAACSGSAGPENPTPYKAHGEHVISWGRCVNCDGHANSAGGAAAADAAVEQAVAATCRFSSQSVRETGPHMAVMEGIDLEIQSWFVDPSEVEFCRRPDGSDWLLGEGSYGKVYKALRGGVQEVAVKVLLCTDEDQLTAFRKEIGILKSISYDRNIVQFYGACLKSATNEPMLLLEYCEGGDVRRALTADREMSEATGIERRLGWYAAGQHIALDVARGLHFLHKSGVTHGDMKAQNVLITGRWAKITDVGVARVMAAPEQSNAVVTLGTFAYAAPEMLLGADWDEKADIYSFGVVLWEICTGEAPNRGRLWAPKVPEQCPASIAALIKECMRPTSSERPTAKEIFDRMQAEASPMLAMVPPMPDLPLAGLPGLAAASAPAAQMPTATVASPADTNINEMLLRRAHSSLSAVPSPPPSVLSHGSNSASPGGSGDGHGGASTEPVDRSLSGFSQTSGPSSPPPVDSGAGSRQAGWGAPLGGGRLLDAGRRYNGTRRGSAPAAWSASAGALNPAVAAFSVARRSGRVRMAADGTPMIMPAGGAPGGSGGDSGAQLPPRGGVRRASQPAGGMRRGAGAAARRTRRSLESPVDLSQLEALDGRRTIARRSLGDKNAAPPLLRQPAASAPAAAGSPRRSGPPPSRRSSRETVRRLSNLGPNPGGMLQPILSGKPLLPSETLSGQLAGLRPTSGGSDGAGNPYLALLAAADSLAGMHEDRDQKEAVKEVGGSSASQDGGNSAAAAPPPPSAPLRETSGGGPGSPLAQQRLQQSPKAQPRPSPSSRSNGSTPTSGGPGHSRSSAQPADPRPSATQLPSPFAGFAEPFHGQGSDSAQLLSRTSPAAGGDASLRARSTGGLASGGSGAGDATTSVAAISAPAASSPYTMFLAATERHTALPVSTAADAAAAAAAQRAGSGAPRAGGTGSPVAGGAGAAEHGGTMAQQAAASWPAPPPQEPPRQLRRIVSDGAASLGKTSDIASGHRPEPPATDTNATFHQAADDLTTERAASEDVAGALAASQPPAAGTASGQPPARPAPPRGGRWVPQTPFAAVAEACRSLDAEQQPQTAPPAQPQQPSPPGQRGSSNLRSASEPDVLPGEMHMDVSSSVAMDVPSSVASAATLSAADASEDTDAADESLRAVSAGSSGSAKSGGANPYALFALRPGPQPLARFSTGGGAATAERERRRRRHQQQQQQQQEEGLPRRGSRGSIASGGSGGGLEGSLRSGSADAGVGSTASSSHKGEDSNPFVRLSDASIAAGETPLNPKPSSNRAGGLGSRDGSGIPRVLSLGSGGIAEALYADGPTIPAEAEAASSSFGGRRSIDAAELYLRSAATFAAAAASAAKLQAVAAAEGDAAVAAGAVDDGGGPSAADASLAAALLEAAGRTKLRSADLPGTGGGRRAGIGSIKARSTGELSQRPIAAHARHAVPGVASPYAMFSLPAAASADADEPASADAESREAGFELRPRISIEQAGTSASAPGRLPSGNCARPKAPARGGGRGQGAAGTGDPCEAPAAASARDPAAAAAGGGNGAGDGASSAGNPYQLFAAAPAPALNPKPAGTAPRLATSQLPVEAASSPKPYELFPQPPPAAAPPSPAAPTARRDSASTKAESSPNLYAALSQPAAAGGAAAASARTASASNPYEMCMQPAGGGAAGGASSGAAAPPASVSTTSGSGIYNMFRGEEPAGIPEAVEVEDFGNDPHASFSVVRTTARRSLGTSHGDERHKRLPVQRGSKVPLSPFAGGGTYRPEAVLQDSVGTLKPSPPAPMSNAAAAAFESASASASAGLPRRGGKGMRRGIVRAGGRQASMKLATAAEENDDSDGDSPRAAPRSKVPEPRQLKGKQRQQALAAAEAAAEQQLDLLISDNSMTWAL